MRTAVGAVAAALAASVCCITPVLFSLLGAGALGASAVRFEVYRPWFLGLTALLLGAAFYSAYRRSPEADCAAGTCSPSSKRTAKIMVWIAAVVTLLLVTFPYYISRLL